MQIYLASYKRDPNELDCSA